MNGPKVYEDFRTYASGERSVVVHEGLTLAEAMLHCDGKDGASTSTTSKAGLDLLSEKGHWTLRYRRAMGHRDASARAGSTMALR